MKQLFPERLRRAGLLPLLLACCLGGAIRPAVAAGIYTVTSTLDDGSSSTLRGAIALANADPGATVVFGPGVSGVIALQGELDITASMTIIGPGAGIVQVDGGSAVRLFNITSPSAQVAISGLTLADGSAFNNPNNVTYGAGGGVYNAATLTLTRCTFGGNVASYGGGIYNVGTLALTGCTLSDNSAAEAGGGIYSGNDSALALAGCTVSANIAFYAGGVYNGGATALTDCTVSGNNAYASVNGNSGVGAGLYNDGGLMLTGCVVSGNASFGGSADNGGPGGSGGGLYSAGTLTMTGCTVSGNFAGPNADGLGGLGGGLDNQGAATLTGDIFYGDYAANATEIANDTFDSPSATVTASYCDIQGSRASSTNFGLAILDVDPLFVSAPTDLHLQGDSPCIGRGIADSTDATDRDSNLRPNPPSIGAYEHTSVGLASLTFPSPVAGGTVVRATVTLAGVMPTDTLVGLSSSDSSVVRVHRAVIVPAGARSATFTINTYRSPITNMVTIRATLGQVVVTGPGQVVVTAPLTITGG